MKIIVDFFVLKCSVIMNEYNEYKENRFKDFKKVFLEVWMYIEDKR